MVEVLIFLYIYTSIWFHIMILLILIELFILKIYILSILSEKIIAFSSYFTYIFITLSVAEASISISLLTLLIRTHGEDNILLINI